MVRKSGSPERYAALPVEAFLCPTALGNSAKDDALFRGILGIQRPFQFVDIRSHATD
jgi:hypothetical protein